MNNNAITFSELLLKLQQYWAEQGCNIVQPYDIPSGAGTFHPATLLRSLDSQPWSAAYVAPSRRPTDGRYGENPNRLGAYYQFQALIKPSPDNIQELYLKSLEYLGLNLQEHDIRFVEDNWESPTLGAWGLGWEVWLDGMEVTQFTYFQQVGGLVHRDALEHHRLEQAGHLRLLQPGRRVVVVAPLHVRPVPTVLGVHGVAVELAELQGFSRAVGAGEEGLALYVEVVAVLLAL